MLSVRGSRCVVLSSYGTCRQAPAAISSASPGGRAAVWPSRAASSAPAVAAASPTTPRCTGRWAPIASSSRSTWMTCADGEMSVPWRVVHWFSAAPKAIIASASCIRRSAVGDEKPPAMPSANGSPANSPLATARGGEHRAGALAEHAQRRPCAGERGAAPGDDRRALGGAQDRGGGLHGRLGRARRRELGAGRGQGRVAVGGLDVERQHQHDRAPLDAGAPHRAGDVGHRGRPARARARRRRRPTPPARPARSGSSTGRCGRRVGGEEQHRRAALGRLGQPGDRVREARSLVDAAGGEPPAHARVAVGRADRAALVAGGDEARAGVAHRVGDRQVAAAEQPEDGVDAVCRQRPPDRLGDQHGGAISGRSAGGAGTDHGEDRREDRDPPAEAREQRE